MYYCLSGKVPTEAMARTIDGEPIDWSAARGLSSEQKAALEKGMAIQAKNRFGTVRELWDSLNPEPQMNAAETFKVALDPEEHSGIAPNRKRILPIIVILLAMMIAVVVWMGSVELNPNITFTYRVNETGWTITGYEGDKADVAKMVVLPREKDGKPVTSIAGYAFQGCSNLSGVTIPDSVTYIGYYAFEGCSSLSSVTIPDSVTSIGNSAFSYCSSLSSVTIPYSVVSIGDYAFVGCSSLTRVSIPDSVTSIGNYAYEGCNSLSSVTIPDSVTTIGDHAFYGCTSLSSVTISRNCVIGISAFPYGCTVNRR